NSDSICGRSAVSPVSSLRRSGVTMREGVLTRCLACIVRQEFSDLGDLRLLAMIGNDDPRLGVVVMDQFAADAAGRDHRDLAGLAGLGMTHSNDGLDPVIPGLGDGAADRNRLGTYGIPADIGIDVDAGHDAAVAGAHGGADLLPFVAVTLADRS